MYACGDGTNSSQGNGSSVGNSTALATPQCEIELLQQRLEQLPQSRLAAAAWEPAGEEIEHSAAQRLPCATASVQSESELRPREWTWGKAAGFVQGLVAL